MVKVLNSSNETLAILNNVTNTIKTEALNREYTFDFSTVIDGDKSQYITTTNKIEVENDWFNIVYFKKNRSTDGITLDVSCEHVSYDLISANFTAGFSATGLFSAVATILLSGTGFTVGTVQVTGNETISVNESTNAFSILKQLATLYSGEIEFDKYQINLLTRRGADNGVQFRYRKNITNATVTVDGRQKIAGVPKTVYEVSPAELEFESSYIANGYATNESYELGDTIHVIDPDLDIDASLRIVKESHNTEQRMLGVVEISNFVDDITDTITNIQTTTIVKDIPYNNVSLGPDNGFVATRSDNLARAIMNATDGIKIQKGDGIGGWTDAIYLDTSGNGTFSGFVLASQIIGGSIVIGTGSNTFNANGTNGIWLGYSAFATAPFSVTLSGAVTADNMLLTGATMQIGTSNNTFRFDEASGLWMGNTVFGSAPFRVTMSGALTAQNAEIIGDIKAGSTFTVATGSNTVRADSDGLYVGSSAFATAPFRVTLSGALTATNGDFTGTINATGGTFSGNISASGTITGGTIQGSTIKTAASGSRIELNNADGLNQYDSNGDKRLSIEVLGLGVYYGYLRFWNGASLVGTLNSDNLSINLSQASGIYLNIGNVGEETRLHGNVAFMNNVNFTAATVSGLESSGYATQTWAAQAGTSTSSHVQGDHNHGIANGTVLLTATGNITWAASGGFSHSHTQN